MEILGVILIVLGIIALCIIALCIIAVAAVLMVIGLMFGAALAEKQYPYLIGKENKEDNNEQEI